MTREEIKSLFRTYDLSDLVKFDILNDYMNDLFNKEFHLLQELVPELKLKKSISNRNFNFIEPDYDESSKEALKNFWER